MSERLRANPLLTYGLLLVLTGIAKGAWQGAYAWFLSVRMGFTPSQIGIVVGAQFIVQIVLEIPSGAWADRGKTRRVLAFAYLAFVFYCVAYLVLSESHLRGGLAVLAALVPEALFGVGAALLSGTLEGWICEREREAANESDDDFARRLRQVHSMSQLWSAVPCALFGGAAFAIATQGFIELPWLLGAAAYMAAFAIVNVGIDQNTLQRDPPEQLDVIQMIGGHVGRAIAFLRNRPETFRLFLCSSLAYMPFFATQLFWIYFLVKTLNVSAADPLGSLGLGTIPLIAALWAAGEMACALGSWSRRRAKAKDAKATLFSVVVSLVVHGAALTLQVVAVLLDWEEVTLYILGYVIARVAEGRIRRDVAVLKDRWILNERSTLQSLDSLIRAIIALLFLTLVGTNLQSDPILGYCIIVATTFIAAYEMASLRKRIARGGKAPPWLWRLDGGWPRIVGRFAKSRYFIYLFIVVGLACTPLVFGLDSRPMWTYLNRIAPEGAVVDIHAIAESNERVENYQRDLGGGQDFLRTRWKITAESSDNLVGCRVPIARPFDLWNTNLEGEVRARIRRISSSYVLEFAIDPKRGIEVFVPPEMIDAITCFRLAPGKDLVFRERLVIPSRVFRLSQQRTVYGSSIVVPELILGFFVMGLLLTVAVLVSRTRLEEVLKLAPGSLLDRAREHLKKSPDEILEPSIGLPSKDFDEFDEIIEKLDATSLIVGGFSEHVRNERSAPSRVDWLWFHDYQKGVRGPEQTEPSQLAAWVLARHAHEDGVDTRSRRLNESVAVVEVTTWPTRTAQEREQALADQQQPDQRYAACAIVRNREREADVWNAGFAIAVFGADKAPRYVATVEAQLLKLLADLARLQADRARRNVNEWDMMHWTKSMLDMIRLPIDKVQRNLERLPESPQRAEAGLAMVGISARVLLARNRLADRLDSNTSKTQRSPELLSKGLAELAKLFTHSRFGAMRVEIANSIEQDLRVPWSTWVLIEGALIELLWNAGKYGPSNTLPDIVVTLSVTRLSPAEVQFLVENPLVADRVRGGAPGYGLKTIPVRVAEHRGRFIKLEIDEATNRASAGFVLPLKEEKAS